MHVLYLDNHLLVINKPAGLLAQADATGDTDVVTEAKAYLKERFNKPGNVYVGLVHRLDRPVSGMMVLARTSKAAGRLSKQFREQHPEKRYFALVEGYLKGQGTQVDYLIKRNRRVERVSPDASGARRAELRWQTVAQHEGLSLVNVELLTGRPHQIRVQLAGLGHSILGDLRYGAQHTFDGRNLALHCYHLGLEHPVQRRPMAWQVAPPKTWAGYFESTVARLCVGTD